LWGSSGEGGSAYRDIETGSIFVEGGGSNGCFCGKSCLCSPVDAKLIVLSSGSEDEVDWKALITEDEVNWDVLATEDDEVESVGSWSPSRI
jgi:hypothetical protein